MPHRVLTSLLALLLLALPLVPASAQDATPTEIAPWSCPEGFQGQTLSVYNWSTYIAENTIPDFEAACGVTVSYDVYDSMESLLARLRQGNPGYDVIVPTDYIVTILIEEGLLIPLDKDAIPNLVNISETFNERPFDPTDEYTVPYQWGTIGIGYNVNRVGEEITSWAQLFEADVPVAWLEDLRGMMSFAMLVQGVDPLSDDPASIEAARDYLIENGRNVVAIAADDGQALLERGDVAMTVEYSGDIFQVIADCACEDYAYVIPEEGSVLWVDNLAVPTGAPNPALAMVFIDYILHPQVGADISNYTAYASPNQAAIDAGLIDEALLSDESIYPPEAVLERLYFIISNPDAEQRFNDAWDAVKVLIGG